MIKTINGVQLNCEQMGSSGEPLVLVHGSWVDHTNWNAVVPTLSQTFRVFTYDRRGHSQSERTAKQGSIQEDVADLAALIETFNIAPVHLAGHSSGGSIVLRLAAERPDLIRRLVVHEPPLFSLLQDMSTEHAAMLKTVQERIMAVVILLETGAIEQGVQQFVETVAFGEGMWEKIPDHVKQTAIFNAPTFLDEMRDPDFFDIDLQALQKFPHPVLLTLGAMSPPFFTPIMDRLAGTFQHVEKIIFHGASHEPEQTHPEAYIDTITSFVTHTWQRKTI